MKNTNNEYTPKFKVGDDTFDPNILNVHFTIAYIGLGHYFYLNSETRKHESMLIEPFDKTHQLRKV